MKKKNLRKTVRMRRRQSNFSNALNIRYVIIGISTLVLIIGITTIRSLEAKSDVLGAATGPIFLARGGDDNQSGSGSGRSSQSSSSDGGGSSSSSSGGSGGQSAASDGNQALSGTSGPGGSPGRSGSAPADGGGFSPTSISDGTSVLCTGPDNKQFQTDFKHCASLNNGWNKPVTFTVLSRPKPRIFPTKTPGVEPSGEVERPEKENEIHDMKNSEVEKSAIDAGAQNPEAKRPEKIEVKTAQSQKGRPLFNIKKHGTTVEIRNEDDRTVVKAKNADNTEVELNEDDALHKLNDALKENEIELEKSSSDSVQLRHKGSVARTTLPLSVNPETGRIMIKTEDAVKTLGVMPHDAVEKLLTNKILTEVEKETLNATESAQTLDKTELIELNGEPAFKIRGVANKKLLGVFSVAFPKTITVSAETGEVRKTDESFFSKLLESISF